MNCLVATAIRRHRRERCCFIAMPLPPPGRRSRRSSPPTAFFRALYLITGDRSEAEEALQDAFLKVWERWPRVRTMTHRRVVCVGQR